MVQPVFTSEFGLPVFQLQELEGEYIRAGYSNINDDILYVHRETGERFAFPEPRQLAYTDMLFSEDLEELYQPVRLEIRYIEEYGESCSWIQGDNEQCDLERAYGWEFCPYHLDKVLDN